MIELNWLLRTATIYIAGAVLAGLVFLIIVFAWARPYEFATFAALVAAMAWLSTRLPRTVAASVASVVLGLRIWRR